VTALSRREPGRCVGEREREREGVGRKDGMARRLLDGVT
jgi:hypothetical protein